MSHWGPARELLFGFPPSGEDGVRFYMETNSVSDTNVIESYYRLEIVKDGSRKSYRLPHDLDQLWNDLNH